MPLYDRVCEACGHVELDLWEKVQADAVPCPECGEPMPRAWLSTACAVVDDSMDHWQVNGTKHPIYFDSKQARKRWLKETSQYEYIKHVGIDSDKSKHTTRWEAMDAYTLNNARILLERAAQQPTRNEPIEVPLKARTTIGDYNSPEFHGWRESRGER